MSGPAEHALEPLPPDRRARCIRACPNLPVVWVVYRYPEQTIKLARCPRHAAIWARGHGLGGALAALIRPPIHA